MLDGLTVAVFVAAALALLLVPGPAVLYIVARGIQQGRRAALVSALGVGLGSSVHVVAATIGLSALLVSSAVAFSIVKYCGAAYLVVLGVRALLSRDAERDEIAIEPLPLRRVFAQGAFVNMLNPKVALFFLAFLPQFVDPTRGPVAVQTLTLGALFVILGIGTDSLYAFLAGTVGGVLRGHRRFGRIQRAVSGCVYLGLGAVTALMEGERTS